MASRIQHAPYRSRKIVRRKWLLNIGLVRLDDVVMKNGVVGIAGHEQYRQVRTVVGQQLREDLAAHPRHHDVREKKIDRIAGAMLGDVEQAGLVDRQGCVRRK